MSNRKSRPTGKKTVVVRMRKAHRIAVLTSFALLFLFMLAAMIYLMSLADYGLGINLLLIAVPTLLFLPCPLYYATWQIIMDSNSIQKWLFWCKQKRRPWTQVEKVRSEWLISERSNGISIIFKDKKAVRFRMDCENAEAARKLILSHTSIEGPRSTYL